MRTTGLARNTTLGTVSTEVQSNTMAGPATHPRLINRTHSQGAEQECQATCLDFFFLIGVFLGWGDKPGVSSHFPDNGLGIPNATAPPTFVLPGLVSGDKEVTEGGPGDNSVSFPL